MLSYISESDENNRFFFERDMIAMQKQVDDSKDGNGKSVGELAQQASSAANELKRLGQQITQG